MTAYGTIENAVEAMKLGAYDFISKPLKRASVVAAVRKALDKQALVVENRELKAQLAAVQLAAASSRSIVGNSQVMRATLETARQAANSSATDPAARRERDRQGAARPLHPRAQPPGPQAVRRDQLRRAARVDPRVRAVRPREGLVHRRGPVARGPVPRGRQRDPVPRRDRRDPAAGPGQAAARDARGRGRAGRRPHDLGRLAPGLRDQPRPRPRRSRPAGSARICSIASTSCPLRIPPLRDRLEDVPLARRSLRAQLRDRATASRSTASARRRSS